MFFLFFWGSFLSIENFEAESIEYFAVIENRYFCFFIFMIPSQNKKMCSGCSKLDNLEILHDLKKKLIENIFLIVFKLMKKRA